MSAILYSAAVRFRVAVLIQQISSNVISTNLDMLI
jgi:hypothetical protein